MIHSYQELFGAVLIRLHGFSKRLAQRLAKYALIQDIEFAIKKLALLVHFGKNSFVRSAVIAIKLAETLIDLFLKAHEFVFRDYILFNRVHFLLNFAESIIRLFFEALELVLCNAGFGQCCHLRCDNIEH